MKQNGIGQIWSFPSEHPIEREHWAADLALPASVVDHLQRHGIRDSLAADRFLRPRLRDLADPFLIPGMTAAAERILQAIDRGQRVVLYGDYDVDGVTSVAMLARLLRNYGNSPATFLPLRLGEGYGLSADGVARCLAEHRPELLVALDCGTSSAARIAEVEQSGTEVVVLDHHEPGPELPRCRSFVNPKMGSEFRYLCTAGLVFKLCHGLLKMRRLPEVDLKEYLDLAAVGTVADIVPLVGENRVLVFHGLRQLEKTCWIGLDALKNLAGVSPPIRPAQVGFRIGPRLNAAGRLGVALDALNLLLTDDIKQAKLLAEALDQQNRERQQVEQQTFDEAIRLLEASFDPAEHAAIVVGASGWHPGVVGIVAARLTRRYHRPAIVVGFDPDGSGKGSGRSIPGFSLVRALQECKSALQQYGGHEMAAGLALSSSQLEAFTTAFLDVARRDLSAEALTPKLRIDGVVTGAELDFALLKAHACLEPFGTGNDQPLLCLRGAVPRGECRIVGEKHRVFPLSHHGKNFSAIRFNGVEEGLPVPPWDIAFYLEANTYRDTVGLQLQIEAMRTAVP